MSFDRVADIYDPTRALPPEVVERIAERIVAATHAGPQTRFLELGVGTGRIALPLIERGYPFTGVDISEEMMARLRQKAGGAENLALIRADITDLPLPDDSVDVVLAVHVFHLLPNWETALDEARRVLRPGGYLVMGDDRALPNSPLLAARRQWRAYVREEGESPKQRSGTWEAVLAALTARGGRTAIYRVAEWEREYVPREALELLRRRTFSDAWDVSDEVLEAVHQRMLEWAQERFGSLDEPSASGMEFLLAVVQIPESGGR